MKAFLLAAGLGTRLKPFTDNHPKALATVNGKTLLEWNIKKLQQFGVNEFVINIHHFGSQITDFLKQNEGFGSRYHISDESEELLNTGGALLKAQSLLGNADNILMMNVDILSNIDLKSMIHFHLVRNPVVTLAVQTRETSRQLLFTKNDSEDLVLQGWMNTETQETKPSSIAGNIPQYWEKKAFSGIQIINSTFFSHLKLKGKFSIIDAYLEMIDTNEIIGYDHTGDIMIDVGKPDALEEAKKIFS